MIVMRVQAAQRARAPTILAAARVNDEFLQMDYRSRCVLACRQLRYSQCLGGSARTLATVENQHRHSSRRSIIAKSPSTECETDRSEEFILQVAGCL